MSLPTLVVISGPPGSGKTTLAHTVAAAIGCPAICRDEIKEGMVHAAAGYDDRLSHDFNLRTLSALFDAIRLLLSAGVTVVAEAAFQDKLWRPGLEPLLNLATLRIIRCMVNADVAHARVTHRLDDSPHRAAHDDRAYLHAQAMQANYSADSFGWITIPAPTLCVDTSDGYNPQLPDVLAFINSPGEATNRPTGAPGG